MASNNIDLEEQSRRSELSIVSTTGLVKFAGLLFITATGTELATVTMGAWAFTADTTAVQLATAIPAVVFGVLTIAFYLVMFESITESLHRVFDRFDF